MKIQGYYYYGLFSIAACGSEKERKKFGDTPIPGKGFASALLLVEIILL
jgi:hypothetical protein